jgi:hypothetical protein
MQGIQADPQTIEGIRERLRKMSDLELRKFGQAAKNARGRTIMYLKSTAACHLTTASGVVPGF